MIPQYRPYGLRTRISAGLSLLIALAATSLAIAQDSCDVPDPSQTRPDPWPAGVVPFTFSGSGMNSDQMRNSLMGMDHWLESGANLVFIPHSGQPAYVQFIYNSSSSNHAQVGYSGDAESITLNGLGTNDSWFTTHEMGHILGFFHEQQRWDRDSHIDIICTNLTNIGNHQIVEYADWLDTSRPFDFYSVMMYRECWGSRCGGECDGSATGCPCSGRVICLHPGADQDLYEVMGDWATNGLSYDDNVEVRNIYGGHGGRGAYYVGEIVAGDSDPYENGSMRHPFDRFSEGVAAAQGAPGSAVVVKGGTYSGNAGTYTTPGRWFAWGGSAVIQ